MNRNERLLVAVAVGGVLTGCGSRGTPAAPPNENQEPANAYQASDASQAPASEIVSVDENFNRYTNHRLGFSMLVPKRHYRFRCRLLLERDGRRPLVSAIQRDGPRGDNSIDRRSGGSGL